MSITTQKVFLGVFTQGNHDFEAFDRATFMEQVVMPVDAFMRKSTIAFDQVVLFPIGYGDRPVELRDEGLPFHRFTPLHFLVQDFSKYWDMHVEVWSGANHLRDFPGFEECREIGKKYGSTHGADVIVWREHREPVVI